MKIDNDFEQSRADGCGNRIIIPLATLPFIGGLLWKTGALVMIKRVVIMIFGGG